MKLGKRSSVLALAIFAVMSLQSVKASDYEISQFRQALSQVQYYEQQYQAAPGGSIQESQANQARNQFEANAEAIINSPAAFQNMSAAQAESLMLEFERGYQAAAGGSILEKAYNAARQAGSRGYQADSIYELQSLYDYNQSLQFSLDAERKYQAAAGGSLPEAAYNNVRTQGFAIAVQKLQDFANYSLNDFRQIEPIFLSYEQQYQAAAGGSAPESYYNKGRQILSTREISAFNAQLNYLNYNDLYSIVNEYNSKYQAAAGGSAPEALYLAIRNAAQSRLNGSVPQPIPQPQPQPQPFPFPPQPQPQPQPQPFPPAPQPQPQPGRITCEIHSGANAAGQQFFRVMTSSGAIIGNFATTQEASAFAQQDPRCRT